MTQSTLFPQFEQNELTPVARETDPQTSHNAAAELDLGKAQSTALRAARILGGDYGDCTANEIGTEAYKLDQSCMAETYRKRVKELERQGWLISVGERRCRETGKVAACYRVRGDA